MSTTQVTATDSEPTSGAVTPTAVPAPGTDYVILRETTPGHYDFVISARAGSSQGAIRSQTGLEEGTYVATPARSFRPIKLKVEQTTRVKLEGV